jgi:gliding motility-associated protein GldM
MAGYKETPRQKMIGMMYLVLTALLALNVSKDILDAFVVVNESLVVTNANIVKKNNVSYSNFEKQNMINPNKVGPFYTKALQAKYYANSLVKYIESLRTEILSKSEGIDTATAAKMGLREVQKKDNYDVPTTFFIGQSQDGSKGKARDLKDSIISFKKRMKSLCRDTFALNLGLLTEDTDNDIEGHQSWEMKNFYHLIMAGVVTNLNRIVSEVRNAEFDVVNKLYSEISVDDFKFDKIDAKVVPKSSYVLVGGEYEADIFVAAYDSKQTPEVYISSNVDTINKRCIGDSTLVEGLDGVVKYTTPASGVGEKKYGGIIKIKKADGTEDKYCFKSEYVVGQPSATISADKMNVFYIGVDNPVTISVPGVPNEQVQASMTGGTIVNGGGGKYTVTVSTIGKATITVAATIGGKSTAMGSVEFRVKKVPDPVATIGGVSGSGNILRATLAAAGGIIPVMKDFDFELYFTITSFTFVMNVKGDLIEKTTTGNKLTADMIKLVNAGTKGTKVYLEDIKAVGPDKTTRTLSPINLKLQ